jgi:hypothetical protein
MTIKKHLVASITILSIILMVGCSKENRIQKNLWNKGGEWNIKTVTFRQTSTNSIDNYNFTVTNAGTFVFQESGSGFISTTAAGITEVESFTYSNTDDKLTLIIDNEADVYNMTWEKNEIELSLNESSFSDDGDLVTSTETISLEKK